MGSARQKMPITCEKGHFLKSAPQKILLERLGMWSVFACGGGAKTRPAAAFFILTNVKSFYGLTTE